MLKTTFILVALLSAQGAVFAHPVIVAHEYESSDIVRRAEPDSSDAPSLDLYGLYDQIVGTLEPPHSSKPHHHLKLTATVVTRDLLDQEDIEARDYWEEDESYLSRRELDDEMMELTMREFDEGELDARDTIVTLEPRRRRRPNRHAKANMLDHPPPKSGKKNRKKNKAFYAPDFENLHDTGSTGSESPSTTGSSDPSLANTGTEQVDSTMGSGQPGDDASGQPQPDAGGPGVPSGSSGSGGWLSKIANHRYVQAAKKHLQNSFPIMGH